MAEEAQSKDVETARKIFEGYLSLKDEEFLSDFIVVVGDKEFFCHRAVLAANSDFFKAALRSGMREAREGRMTLEGVTDTVFLTLLTCLYGGKYVLTEENIFDLWAAADMFQIRFVVDQCVAMCKQVFDSQLSKENCVEYLCKVRLLDEQATMQVLYFVCERFFHHDIQASSTRFKMDEVIFLVSRNDLNFWSEEQITTFVLNWATGNQPLLSQQLSEEDLLHTYEYKQPSDSGCLADILECTRYMLISERYLHWTLSRHSLVSDDIRCRHLVDKITRYQCQPCLHQSWCPPAAIHREHSDMANVLLVCRLNEDGRMTMLDLANNKWKQLNLPILTTTVSIVQMFCYHSEIYIVSQNSINKYSAISNDWQSTKCFKISGMVRMVGDSIREYECKTCGETLAIYRYNIQELSMVFISDATEYLDMGVIAPGCIEGMCLEDITYIDSTEILFLRKEGINGYMILTSNMFDSTFAVYPNQLGSSSRLVTFRHDKEAFVLQENGCLWRIQLDCEPPNVHIENVLALWDEEIPLNGACLYNDELLIVGDFKDQSEVFVPLDLCLAGVFRSVRKIKLSSIDDKGFPSITLAVLPKRMVL